MEFSPAQRWACGVATLRNYYILSSLIHILLSSGEPPPPYSLQSYEHQYDEGDQHSSSSVYPSLAMSSPRRRVSSSLDCSQGSSLVQDTTQAVPAVASLPAATLGTPVQETMSATPGYPASCQSGLDVGVEAVPPTVLPFEFDPPRSSVPPPRPPVSPGQAAAAVSTPQQPPVPSAISKTSKPGLVSADLSSSPAATLPEALLSAEAQHHLQHHHHHHHQFERTFSGDFKEHSFHSPEHPVDESQALPPLSFTGSLNPAHGAGKHLGKNSAISQGLEIVDFIPDWDNNYEEDLSMAVGGVNMGRDQEEI